MLPWPLPEPVGDQVRRVRRTRHLEVCQASLQAEKAASAVRLVREPQVRLIADDFVCIPRGMIQVEGQGESSTWFLESRSNWPFLALGVGIDCSTVVNTQRRRLSISGLSFGIVLVVAGVAFAAPGDLDPTFGNGGIVIEDLGAVNGNGTTGVVDSEGRVLALGRLNDGGWDFVIYRYLPDGEPDPTWGTNGVARVDIDGDDHASDLAITPDGGVAVVGTSGPLPTSDMSIVKLTAQGALDTGFSSDGKLEVDFGARDAGLGVTALPDGRIVAVGQAGVGGVQDLAVTVIRPNGQFDTSFAGDGSTTLDLGGNESGEAVAVAGDGSIAIAGEHNGSMLLAVYRPTGTLDPAFSGDGVTTYNGTGPFHRANAVAMDESGRIVIAGEGFEGASHFVVLRYNRNGTLDAGFGDQGIRRFPIGGDPNTLRDMEIAPTGHLVLAGFVGPIPNRNLVVTRLTVDGDLDASFGQGGYTTTDIGGDDFGRGLAVGEDGAVFVIGDTDTAGTKDLLVVRYEGTPPPIPDPDPECVESFDDDNGHLFEKDINCIATAGISRGCNPPANDRFCPDSTVTRGQMAAFLTRALELDAGDESFTDSIGHTFEDDIAALATADITRGCNPPTNDRFCPDQRLTRGQMAAFLVRALGLNPSNETFVDTAGHTFEKDVAALAGAGITRGCNPPDNTRFCPDQPVTRGQMAAFLNRALLGD